MNELNQAISLADNILDRTEADPDDDLAMLSRQLLRGRETIDRMREALGSSVVALEEAAVLLEAKGLPGCATLMRHHAKLADDAARRPTVGHDPDAP